MPPRLGPSPSRVSPKYLEEHTLLPLGVAEDGTLLVAVSGPLDPAVADELRQTYGRRISLVEAPAAEIQSAILSASNETPSLRTADLRTPDLEVVAPEEEATRRSAGPRQPGAGHQVGECDSPGGAAASSQRCAPRINRAGPPRSDTALTGFYRKSPTHLASIRRP